MQCFLTNILMSFFYLFRFGDAFMRQMQPVAGLLPYMTCPGNHENHYNFLNYKSRFTMPGGGDNYLPDVPFPCQFRPSGYVYVEIVLEIQQIRKQSAKQRDQ